MPVPMPMPMPHPDLHTAVLADGPGQPVVLSHALGLDHTMWRDWAATQAGRRPVLAYDHRGHGRSARPHGPLTVQALVDDAVTVIDAWGRGPVVWIGLSMGGMVGQGLAIQRPGRLRGLVLAHTAARYPAAARPLWAQRITAVATGGMAAVVDQVVARYLHEAFRADHPELAAALRAQLLACDPAGYTACCHAVAGVDWLDRLQDITCPTLVLAGALDLGAPPEMARAIQQRIPGARLDVFTDASHLSPWEQPQAFQHAIEAFFRTTDLP
ncbi:MAG: 3-oxoadipate enol-lactonase [Pseudomonadota bacterium]|jgi:3-oxoadipate enol-lactonase